MSELAKKKIIGCLKKHDTSQDNVSETLFNVYPDEMRSIVELISKHENYMKLLLEELGETSSIARTRGWESARVEEGSNRRNHMVTFCGQNFLD